MSDLRKNIIALMVLSNERNFKFELSRYQLKLIKESLGDITRAEVAHATLKAHQIKEDSKKW